MNWDAVIAVAEIIGVLGIIASLVYVAAQVKQSTMLGRAEMVHATSDSWGNYARMLATDGELAEIYLRNLAGEQLTPVETLRMQFIIETYMTLLEDSDHQYKSDLYFSEDDGVDLVEFIAPTFKKLFQSPVGRHWWATIAESSTTPSLYAKMDRIMRNWDEEEST